MSKALVKSCRQTWIVKQLLDKPRTYDELCQKWKDDQQLGSFPNPSTLWRDIQELPDLLGVFIRNRRGKDGKYYYEIENSEDLQSPSAQQIALSSYAVLNQVQMDKRLRDRIVFEDIPSGEIWLTTILAAMRHDHEIVVEYQRFETDEPRSVTIQPYCLKIYQRRWYLVGKVGECLLTYALDRMLSVQETGTKFKYDKSFRADAYFEGAVGVMGNDDVPIQDVQVRFYPPHCYYVETCPLHRSQHIIARDENGIVFGYHLRPNFEFVQLLLMGVDMFEVVSPRELAEKMREIGNKIYYNHWEA